MTLDSSIENLQCNMNILVNDENKSHVFEGTIGDLSALQATLGQKQICFQPFFCSKINAYYVEIVNT